MATDTSVSFARWQQGDQAVAWVGVVCEYLLGSVQTSHYADITDGINSMCLRLMSFCESLTQSFQHYHLFITFYCYSCRENDSIGSSFMAQ